MNPAKLNHRIKFIGLSAPTPDEYGGVTAIETDLLITWGSLVPVKQSNQLALEAGASVLNGDKILIIRKRNSFIPAKDMKFQDLNNPSDTYTVHSIFPIVESQSKNTPFNDNWYIQILGIKRK